MLFAQCRYDEGIGNDRSSEGNATLNGIFNIIDANIRRPVRWNSVIEKDASQLVEGADILVPQSQTCKAAAVCRVLVGRPTEKISLECLGLFRIGRGEIEPAEPAGIRFA